MPSGRIVGEVRGARSRGRGRTVPASCGWLPHETDCADGVPGVAVRAIALGEDLLHDGAGHVPAAGRSGTPAASAQRKYPTGAGFGVEVVFQATGSFFERPVEGLVLASEATASRASQFAGVMPD